MRILKSSLLTLVAATAAFAGVDVHVNIGTAPYYGYPPPVVYYAQQYVPDYEMENVFFISRYAGIQPAVVVNLYRGGWGWDRICARYRVPRQAFYGRSYYPGPYGNGFYAAPGPPRGNAWGHGKHWEKHYDKHERGRDRW